jgi:hypothetical protein
VALRCGNFRLQATSLDVGTLALLALRPQCDESVHLIA